MTDNGGPAFPRPYSHFEDGPDIYTGYHEQDGMTLRDWFAGQWR